MVFLHDTPTDAADQLIADWQKELTDLSLKDSILLAFTRAAVAELNEKARDALKKKGLLGHDEFDFQGIDKALKLSTGDRLLLRQNDRDIGVRNGDLGTITAIHQNGLKVELDSGELLNIPKTYQSIDYGYALTVHKSQGMTVEHTKVLIDSQYWDRHLSFVAMTRHKQNLAIYADTINHPDLDSLKRSLRRSITKDNVIDWPIDFAIRAGFNPDKLMGKVVNHLAGAGHKIQEGFNYIVNYEKYLLNTHQKSRYQNKAEFQTVAKQVADYLNSQYQFSKQYCNVSKEAKRLGINILALPEYRLVDQQAKVRDKMAHSLWSAHKEKLGEIQLQHLNPEKIKQAAARHEQLVIAEKYNILKTQYPLFAQYDELLKQRKHLTGYYREKIDKKLQQTTTHLIADKNLMAHIKQVSFKTESQIIRLAKANLGRDIDRDQ